MWPLLYYIVCCEEQGVSDQCQTVCKFEIDFDSIFNKPQCFSELDKYMYCAEGIQQKYKSNIIQKL